MMNHHASLDPNLGLVVSIMRIIISITSIFQINNYFHYHHNYYNHKKALAKYLHNEHGHGAAASSVDQVVHLGQTSYLSFFSTNVFLGSIFLHMKARKLWQNCAHMATFSSSHTCHMWRISDLSTSVT